MTRHLRIALLTLTCGAALAFTGCGSSFSCDSKSACSADGTPSADDVAACKAEMDGACGSQYKDFGQCVMDHQTCLDDNTTDPASIPSCSTQAAALASCEESNQ